MSTKKVIGQTKSTGFQFGLRKTFSISPESAWDALFAPRGIDIWLGELPEALELKKSFVTQNGISGLVRVFKPNSHIRLNWKRPDWENTSTLQIRIIPNGDKTTISFHQEKLLDANQRLEMKKHWNAVLDQLTAIL